MAESDTKPSAPSEATAAGWAPFRHPDFRNLWLAAIVSNLGGWMQDTAGTWLMAALTSSPLLIALMQTAAGLPVLFLALPAGAMADIFDRRRLLIVWQTWMLVAVALLSLLAINHSITPGTLLLLTFLLNFGSAMNNPAWQAVVPELVPRAILSEAIALNSAGFNLARAVGPALGGLVVAAFISASSGAGIVFLVNSISFVGVIMVLFVWHRLPLFKSALPAERILGSIRAGLRYTRHSPQLHAILLRTVIFTFCASSLWALLAVVARQDLHQGAMGYGILNGCIGVGAVLGATFLPRTRRLLHPNRTVGVATIIFALSLAVLALARNVPLIVIWLIASGFAWTSTTATLNVAVQTSIAPWVQARILGVYQMVFWGGMALGSALWGVIAQHFVTGDALLAAAAGLLLSLGLARRWQIPDTIADLTPFWLNRPAPELEIEPHPQDGPVLIAIEYEVRRVDSAMFIHAAHALRNVRMRDGAIRWGLFEDAAHPERFIETFVTDSWLEFLRQRERMSTADRMIRDHAWSYHRGANPPVVSFMIYARESSDPAA